MAKRCMLTGAGGFLGAHVLRHLLTETGWEIICPVTFRHRGNSDRIASSIQGNDDWHQRTKVIMHDLTAPLPLLADRAGSCDYVLALAAESHVDRSIADPVPFIRNNTDVMLSTLQYARAMKPDSVIVFSTDEVYGPMDAMRRGATGPGPLPDTWDIAPHREWSPILPSNPYAASKACQEAIAISYWRTYGVPVVIVNSMNLFGEMQDPEKFLPMTISKILRGETVMIHGVPGDIGSRFFIHARNVADALLFLLEGPSPAMFPAHAPQQLDVSSVLEGLHVTRVPVPAGPVAGRPDRYNVVGERRTNLELARQAAEIVGKPLRYELADFHSARPGHDPHYGLDGAKLAGLGWEPPVGFGDSLTRTVRWMLSHPEWLA
jgi:dTDP-glucose 4,6-dehydratase